MSDESQQSQQQTSYWTPGRLGFAVAIVLAAGVFIGIVAWREVVAFGEAADTDALYARLLQSVTDEHAAEFDLTNLTIDRSEISFGGPPKDGIPAINKPEIVDLADISADDTLRDDDRMIGVVVDGLARAYPIRVLMYHEAVNDTIGDTPITVVYCPLCDSVTVVDRRLDGVAREFGISGLLTNSNVLLFDRTDDSLWSQVGFTAISGPNAGRSLTHLPWEITTAGAWREAHPDSTVMTFNTGFKRNYNQNPYPNYFDSDDALLFPVAHEDDRFSRRELVIGVKLGDAAKAYPVAAILAAPDGLVRDAIGGETVVLQAGSDGKSVRVVEAPAGAHTVHTFWFAWVAFHPETAVYER